jgi:hypothetical protein
MNTDYKRIKTFPIFTAFLLAVVSLVVIFGLSFSMSMNNKGAMISCPFMHDSMSLCPMNASEHVFQWNSAFTGIPQNQLMGFLLALISLGLVFLFIKKLFVNLEHLFTLKYTRYKTDHPNIPLFNYLSLIFASGILQPKLYA